MKGLWNTGPVVDQANLSATGGNVPIRQYVGGVVFVHAPTGTMANNGAVTFGTSLGRTLANAWMLFPSGSIAAGVPSADTWYFVQMSSATVGTVFNNIYTTGAVTAPASPTAFATTGPGAFTGSTTEAVGPNVSMAGGTMGANGRLRAEQSTSNNNSAGAKGAKFKLGSATFWSVSATTGVAGAGYTNIQNQGSQSVQLGDTPSGSYHPLGAGGAGVGGVQDTSTALVIAHTLVKAVATDFAILENYVVYSTQG